MGYHYIENLAYGGSWGYCYYSTTGSLSMSTENGNNNGGTTPPYCYFSTSSYSHHVDYPHDLAGDPMMIITACYYCYYYAGNDEYQLEITVWPGDAGLPGDQVQALSLIHI